MRTAAATPLMLRTPIRRQRGVVLMVALIVLVGLTLAGLSMVRSADTGSVIAGNLAFRQSAINATEVGVQEAYKLLPTLTSSAQRDAVQTGAYYVYFPTMKSFDGAGVPKNFSAGVFSDFAWGSGAAFTTTDGSQVRFVVERMCVETNDGVVAPIPAAALQNQCFIERVVPESSFRAGAGTGPTSSNNYPLLRVTVRVDGPRNTVRFAQAILSYVNPLAP